MARVRVVLIGCGHLGRYHLQKIVADEGADLVAVVEPDAGHADQARALLQQLRHEEQHLVVPSLKDVTAAADACIVATPTHSHKDVVLTCLAMGWHVLVEKPMAKSTADARMMARAAQDVGRILQVGHLERFNPAVEAAALAAGPVHYMVAERLGPFSGRATDVDVVLDLMIHDLDLIAVFADAPVHEVRAVGMPVLTDSIDMATARIVLQNGTVVQLSAGRTSLKASRKLRLFTTSGYMSVDCAAKTVHWVHREGHGANCSITGGTLSVPEQDALAAQDRSFFRSITEGTPTRACGEDGLLAMKLAEAVKQAMQSHVDQFFAT